MSFLLKFPYELKANKNILTSFFLASVSIEQTCGTSEIQVNKLVVLSLIYKFLFQAAIITDARTCTNEFNHIHIVVFTVCVCTSCYNSQITPRLRSGGINRACKRWYKSQMCSLNTFQQALIHISHLKQKQWGKELINIPDPFCCNLVMHSQKPWH